MRYPHFGETKPIDVQDREEDCIRRICKHFGWLCDVSPSPKAFNYEAIKLRLREYIALTPDRATLKFYSNTRGEGHTQWHVFEDFLELMDAVERFSSNTWLHDLDLPDYNLYPVRNPFFGKGLKTLEEVEIFLDLLETAVDASKPEQDDLKTARDNAL